MRNSPQQLGSQFPNGPMSMPQSLVVQNNMAQFGQMPNATLQQHGQHQMQRQPSAVDGYPDYTPEQLRQMRAQGGNQTLFAQIHERLAVNEVEFENNMQRSAHHTAGSVSLSSPTMPQPGQKRPLNNAGSPPSKRQATHSPDMNGAQRANITAQHYQLGQNQHTPNAMNRAQSMSAAFIQQPGQNPPTPIALNGGRNMSAVIDQTAGMSNMTPEQCNVFLKDQQMHHQQHMHYQQRMQNQQPIQHQQHLQSQQPTQNQRGVQYHQGAHNQQGIKSQQGTQNQQQGMQNQRHVQNQQGVQRQQGTQNQQQAMQSQRHVQNQQPTQQQIQQRMQNQYSIQTRQPVHNQHAQQRQMQNQHPQQNRTVNEQRIQTPHQSNTQVGVSGQQQAASIQHQQRVRLQSMAQNGISRQPQTPAAQMPQQAQAPGDVQMMICKRMIRDRRLEHRQDPDFGLNPLSDEEKAYLRSASIQSRVQNYVARFYTLNGNKATAQVAAPDHAQFPQQDARQQQRPVESRQQMPVQQQQISKQQQQQQARAEQAYHQNQQRYLQERQETIARQQAVQQPQTHQQQAVQHQHQQTSAVSGTPRASVPSTSPSVVGQNKNHQGLASSSPAATSVNNPYSSPDRQGHPSSSPPLQQSTESPPRKDDVEFRLEAGLQEWKRRESQSASPKQNSGHNSSSPQAVTSSLAPQSSQQSVSSTSASAMPGTGTNVSDIVVSRPKKLEQSQGATAADPPNASAQQQASLAPSPASGAAPVQQTGAPSPSTSPTNNVTGHTSGEQSRPSSEPTSPIVPSGSSHGETSASGAGNSAPIEGASGGSLLTTNPGYDFFNAITNPVGDWQLLDNAEAGYGLWDAGLSPTLLPADAWVDAAPPSNPPVRFPEEEGVNNLLEISGISVPPPEDMSEEQRLQKINDFLHPEARTAGENSNVGQNDEIDWNETASDAVGPNLEGICRCYMAQGEAQGSNGQVEEEAEPTVEAEPTFASHTGSYTSPADAFNHRMNRELGVGWDVHNDPRLFPDRDQGTVDPAILQMIGDGTYAPTVFEYGIVHDVVPKPKANGGADSGEK